MRTGRPVYGEARAMEAEGFAVYPPEWWHFDHEDWRLYAILDLPCSAIAAAR